MSAALEKKVTSRAVFKVRYENPISVWQPLSYADDLV
jgi:hypothetical protein